MKPGGLLGWGGPPPSPEHFLGGGVPPSQRNIFVVEVGGGVPPPPPVEHFDLGKVPHPPALPGGRSPQILNSPYNALKALIRPIRTL